MQGSVGGWQCLWNTEGVCVLWDVCGGHCAITSRGA